MELALCLIYQVFFMQETNAQSNQEMIPESVDSSDLKNRNPRDVATDNLKITPLNNFGTFWRAMTQSGKLR